MQSNRLIGTFLIAAIAVLGLTGTAIATPQPGGHGHGPSVTDVSGFLCPGQCFQCSIFEEMYQVLPEPDPVNEPGNDSDDKTTCGHHLPCGSCGVSLDNNLQQVRAVLASEDQNALPRLLELIPGVELNRHRRALQIFTCTADDVAASIPLTEDELLRLAAAMQ